MSKKNELPPAFTEKEKYINAIIETPADSRNKYEYVKENGLFRLKKVLPQGFSFPCDFGFIPHTKGEDGDPLDVLVMMDEYTYPGCLIECRLLGVIKAEQSEQNKKIRNDRFVAVPAEMKEFDHLKDIYSIDKNKLNSIIKFFEFYNEMEGKKFKLIRIDDEKKAQKLIRKQMND
jgi:inorganic pyrophosphatase